MRSRRGGSGGGVDGGCNGFNGTRGVHVRERAASGPLPVALAAKGPKGHGNDRYVGINSLTPTQYRREGCGLFR